jgi:hypothetical protein
MSARCLRLLGLSAILILLALNVIGTVYAASFDQSDVGITAPYSGQLNGNQGKPVAEGIYAFEFYLYGAAEGGELLWSEVQKNVRVKNGLFNTTLGSINIFHQKILEEGSAWLAVAVRGPDESLFSVLNPRQELSATGLTVPQSTNNSTNCPHDYFDEQWIGSSTSAGLYIRNTIGSGGAAIVVNSNSGPALSIEQSSLQVKNDGLDKDTPVFIHQVKTTGGDANLCSKGSWSQYYATVGDHPLTNNNYNAILFITSNYGLASSSHVGPAQAPYGVYYDDR